MSDDTYTVVVNVEIQLNVTDNDDASQLVAQALATEPRIYQVTEQLEHIIYHTN